MRIHTSPEASTPRVPSSISSQPPKLPRSLQKLKRKKDKLEKRTKIAIYIYCGIGAILTLGSFVFSVKNNKQPFFRNPALIILYLAIIMLTFSLFSFICFQGFKQFRNAFSILRLQLIASYVICFVALMGSLCLTVDLILRVTDSEYRYKWVIVIPHEFVFLSSMILNVLICRSHKGTIFKKNPEADVDKLEFGSQIMKEIGKMRGESILKEAKHSKLVEESEGGISCVICCLPMDVRRELTNQNQNDRAFELAKCHHTFHHFCLKEWIKRMNTSCPICRDQVFQQN